MDGWTDRRVDGWLAGWVGVCGWMAQRRPVISAMQARVLYECEASQWAMFCLKCNARRRLACLLGPSVSRLQDGCRRARTGLAGRVCVDVRGCVFWREA